MSEQPLVSIITPSYNQGKFIKSTLLSVKNQDYPNIEHVIADGGSSDNTLEVLRKYEKQYNLRWISEPDKGVGDALNKAFRMSKGKIVGWLNSDDVYFDKQVISYVVEQFKSHPDIDVIHGDSLLIDKDNLIFGARHSVPWFSRQQLYRDNIIFQASSFYRRKVVQRNPYGLGLGFRVDYDQWLRIAKTSSRFRRVGKVLSARRIHDANVCQRSESGARAETRRVQAKYGQKFNLAYYVLSCCDWPILTLVRRVAGLGIVVWLYTKFNKRNLAFPAKFGSCSKMMLRQVFPFV
jgi:glycosyltransferase involved in cell wall biosynthesis